MTTASDLDQISSAALDAWAAGALNEVSELSERAVTSSLSFATATVSDPTMPWSDLRRQPGRRRLAVSVCVAVALIGAAAVVGLVVAPRSSAVRLKPARSVPARSDAPGRYENAATAYVEPSWWPRALRSPIQAVGIGSSTVETSWLVRRNGAVAAVAWLTRNDAQSADVLAGQTVVVDPTDASLKSVSIQLDTHTLLSVSSTELSAADLGSFISGFDRTSRSFPSAAPGGVEVTPDPDAWIATAPGTDVLTTVTKWSGRAGDDRQLSIGGRAVSDAATLVTAIGQYNPGSDAVNVGSTSAVLLPAVEGRVRLFWAVSPTVLGMVEAQGMPTADLLHAARSTAVVPRAWWWALRHRKPAERTVHGFRVADTDVYLTSGTLGKYRWLVTQGIDGLFLTYSDRAGRFLGGEGRIRPDQQSRYQPAGTLSIASSGPIAEISLNLPHGAKKVRATINGAQVPVALFHLPGTDLDKVIAIGQDPSYEASTTLGSAPLRDQTTEHASVAATLPDGSPYSASV